MSGDWREAFLAALTNTGNVRYACQQAGIARRTAYDRRETDVEFAAAWKDAMEDAIDHIEAVAFEKAKEGENVLLIFLLKSHRREVYGERVGMEHSGPGGRPIQTEDATIDLSKLTPDEVDHIESILRSAETRAQATSGDGAVA